MKLWFVNLGGYDPAQFNELHSNIFVVAPGEAGAKARALQTVPAWEQRHKDGLMEVETLIGVGDLLMSRQHIHLTEATAVRPFRFECGYRPLNKTGI